MSTDKIRQDFEEHTRTLLNFTEDMLRRKPNGAYWEPTVYAAFEGYKIGRATERAEIGAKLLGKGEQDEIARKMQDDAVKYGRDATPYYLVLTRAAITKIRELI